MVLSWYIVDRSVAAARIVGETYGNRNWTPPVYGSTSSGHDVTVSFGLGPRDGEVLIASDHLDRVDFYGDKKLRVKKHHDHYDAYGNLVSDRGSYREEWHNRPEQVYKLLTFKEG